MIPTTAAVAAITVAQEFDKRGLMLNATPGTPLAQINDCFSLAVVDVVGVKEYTPNPEVLTSQSNNWNTTESKLDTEHAIVIDTLSNQIAKHVQTHLNFAKNTVRPIIEELVTEFKKDIESLPVNTEFNMEVEISDLPEPMVESSFEDAIMEYKDTNYFAISSYMAMPSITAPEIMEMLITGNKSTDKAISIWAAKKGDSFFQMIWNCVFTSEPTDLRFENLIKDQVYGADAAIAIYLLANKLFDNPMEGMKQSLANYNKSIAEIRSQAALRIVHAYGEFIRFKTTGLLIKNYTSNKVVVVGDNYRKWIEEGGKNAILFGSILSDKTEKYTSDIDANRTEFLKAWERHNWFLTVAERNRRFVHYKELFKECTLKVVSDNFKQCYGHLGEESAITVNLPEYIQFQTNLDNYIPTISESWFNNIWKLCQEVVCKCIFYYTDADKILDGIEKACKDNDGIDIREAALLSTIAYITDYVCDQMVVSSL